VQESKNPKVLTLDELKEGFDHVQLAAQTLHRPLGNLYPYVKNLLARNWFQVKNSEKIYAIGTFLNSKHKLVNGGTGWAVQMAIDAKKDVFFFDQDSVSWYAYSFSNQVFGQIDYIPRLTPNFAGIGTREISQAGIDAIKRIYTENFVETPHEVTSE
jgi:hypothetical protein